jgi:CheY-like chemotaxis protein
MREVFAFWIKRLLVFFSIPLVVMVTVEILCRILEVPKISHNNIEAKSLDLLPQIDGSTVVIVGDSRLEWGIRPEVLENALKSKNVKVINLAMPGSNGLDVLRFIQENEITPYALIVGNTVFYGHYTNHNLHAINSNIYQRMKSSFSYFAKQHLYSTDQSVMMYLHDESVYFKSHVYDERGGAIVEEYGDYSGRLFYQEKMYSRWHDQFNSADYCAYTDSLNSFIHYFSQKQIPVVLLRMPVSRKIHSLEPDDVNCSTVSTGLTARLDYTNWRNAEPAPDSVQFYDGSHLTVNASVQFSNMLGAELNKILH